MLDEFTRPLKESFLAPLARLFSGLHPNFVTLVALIFGLIATFFASQALVWPTFLFWALNRIADGLDGTVARLNKQQCDLGGYLDILSDFVVYAAVPVGLVFGRPDPNNWIALAVLLAIYYVNAASWMFLSSILEKRASGAAARGEMTSVTMTTGLIGGTETAFTYCLFILFPDQLMWLFAVFSALVVFTMIQRLIWAVRHL